VYEIGRLTFDIKGKKDGPKIYSPLAASGSYYKVVYGMALRYGGNKITLRVQLDDDWAEEEMDYIRRSPTAQGLIHDNPGFDEVAVGVPAGSGSDSDSE
jgi:hypothetical protein